MNAHFWVGAGERVDDSLARWLFIAIGFLSAAIYVVLAILAFQQRARRAALRWWAVYCAMAGVHLVSLVASEFARDAEEAELVIRSALSLGAVAMFFFFVFSVQVTELVRGRRAWLVFGGLWGLVVLGLIWAGKLVVAGVTRSEFAHYSPVTGSLTPLYMSYVAFNWIFALVLFVKRYRETRGRERTQTAYTLASFVFGLVGSAGFLIPSVSGSQSLLALMPAFLFPLFPLTITYAMIRLRLWDVRTIVHQTAVWSVLSALLALPIYLMLWLLVRFGSDLDVGEGTLVLSLLFLLAGFYLSKVKPRLDAWFGRGVYDRRLVLDRFERDMVGIKTLDEVCRLMDETLNSTLQPSWIRFWLRGQRGDWLLVLPGQISRADPDQAPRQLDRLGRLVLEIGSSVERDMLNSEAGQAEISAWMEGFDGHAVLGLGANEEGEAPLGIILLGERRNLKAYSRGDLELLDSIATASFIGLTNALLFERLDMQRRDLADLSANLERRVEERTQEIDEANRQLRSVNERLRELDRMKSQFFANISHELRTPLSLILAPVDTMLDGGAGTISNRQREHLEAIARNGMQLFRMIEDLLDLCKLEDSRLRLDVRPLELGAFLRRLVDAMGFLASRKSISLDLEVNGAPVRFEADEEKLERILTNLLGNALKFSDVGACVHIRAGGKGENIWISVNDDGCGISGDDLPHIFDRFRQGSGSTSRYLGGAGIGLALAKELCELHGGSLEVESLPGRGTSFILRLPRTVDGLPAGRIERRQMHDGEWPGDCSVDKPESSFESKLLVPMVSFDRRSDTGSTRRQSSRAESGPKSARILLVDDNLDLLHYLEALLSDIYEVWTAEDGLQALALLKEHHHELVLADVMMPGMSGLELCHRIKSDPALADVPVALLTARSGQEHRIEGHGVGADQYLTKPFRPKELLAVVDRLLVGRGRNTRNAARRRSATLDSLLAGMAHELRNACHQAKGAQAAVQKLLGQNLCSEDRLNSMTAIVNRGIERIERVVNSLQSYAGHRLDDPWSTICLSELIRVEVPLLVHHPEKEVAIRLSLTEPALVFGPAEALRQMVINLVENAVLAVEPKGQVSIETLCEVGQVSLVVRDDGCGIPPENKEAVFDLFFTTRPPGQGTGMGLALVKRTVEELGGRILLESQMGVGTRVTVVLPAAIEEG